MEKNIILLRQTTQLKALYTIIRDKNTKRKEFIFYSGRIIRLLVEEGMNLLPVKNKQIVTPTGSKFYGLESGGKLCAVSILRSGESMAKVVKEVCPGITTGKILIQRDKKTAEPILFYSKLPKDISDRYVLLLDPMLATGGSVCKAITVLEEKGVKQEKIIFINLISAPEGIKRLTKEFPKTKVVTGVIDKKLNSKAYILPGLGDFGDRYFGT